MELYFEPNYCESYAEESINFIKVTKKSVDQRINDMKGFQKAKFNQDAFDYSRFILSRTSKNHPSYHLQDDSLTG